MIWPKTLTARDRPFYDSAPRVPPIFIRPRRPLLLLTVYAAFQRLLNGGTAAIIVMAPRRVEFKIFGGVFFAHSPGTSLGSRPLQCYRYIANLPAVCRTFLQSTSEPSGCRWKLQVRVPLGYWSTRKIHLLLWSEIDFDRTMFIVLGLSHSVLEAMKLRR